MGQIFNVFPTLALRARDMKSESENIVNVHVNITRRSCDCHVFQFFCRGEYEVAGQRLRTTDRMQTRIAQGHQKTSLAVGCNSVLVTSRLLKNEVTFSMLVQLYRVQLYRVQKFYSSNFFVPGTIVPGTKILLE